jgi:carboxymethylenebutenolidase
MCFDFDARPPELPAELALPPLAGGAGAELLELPSADGTAFSAALAESPQGGDPGVVILPDVRGLFPFYMELAERFAQAGHPAIAIDYFGRTAGLGPRGEDFEYMPHVQQTTTEQIQADTAAALGALRERTGVRTAVTVGFCFGGRQSLLAGTSSELGLDGLVSFYGSLGAGRLPHAAPLDHAHEIRCPVLGLYGGADAGIPVEQVHELESRIAGAGVPHELVIYPGAPHSFFDRSFEEHAEACADAWRRVLGFSSRLAGSTPHGPATKR